MKIVADTDILSTFARIGRLGILHDLFEVVVPPSVRLELAEGKIDIRQIGPDFTRLTTGELKYLKYSHDNLGRGERECYVIARSRGIPLASNEKIVHRLCDRDGMSYLSLTRILRLAVTDGVITRSGARQIVSSIESEEHTIIKNKDEIFG